MSSEPPGNAIDAIRAMVDDHDSIAAEAESAHRAMIRDLFASGDDDELKRSLAAEDADLAQRRRLEGKRRQGLSKDVLIDAMRHLLDVVDRQRAEMKEHEWTAHGPGHAHYCPRCKNGPTAGHAPDCALDALLRETA